MNPNATKHIWEETRGLTFSRPYAEQARLSSLADAIDNEERSLDAGADYAPWPGSVATRDLISATREGSGQCAAPASRLGSDTAIDHLRSYDGARLTLGYVDDTPRGGYYFQLFFTPERTEVIACIGVKPGR